MDLETIQQEVDQDPKLQKMIEEMTLDPLMHPKFSIDKGKLLYKNRVVISSKSTLIPTILHTYHDFVMGGHSGYLRTYKRLTWELYWKNMKKDVKDYVERRIVCQMNKVNSLSSVGLLQTLPIPERVWEDMSMDFVEGLTKSKGYDTIFVVIDRLNKYGHFIALKHPFTAKEVASVFIKQVVKLHRFPHSIISDKDKIFLSKFWSQGTQLRKSIAFHPQTDGQTEIVIKCIENYLRCFCGEQPKKWEEWLSWAEYWYNTTFHSSLNMTPCQVVYGRPPPPLLAYGD